MDDVTSLLPARHDLVAVPAALASLLIEDLGPMYRDLHDCVARLRAEHPGVRVVLHLNPDDLDCMHGPALLLAIGDADVVMDPRVARGRILAYCQPPIPGVDTDGA